MTGWSSSLTSVEGASYILQQITETEVPQLVTGWARFAEYCLSLFCTTTVRPSVSDQFNRIICQVTSPLTLDLSFDLTFYYHCITFKCAKVACQIYAVSLSMTCPMFFCTLYLLFADDTKCLKRIKEPADSFTMQLDLDNLSNWSKPFNLSFNQNKFVHLHFWSNTTSPDTDTSVQDYYINGTNCHL